MGFNLYAKRSQRLIHLMKQSGDLFIELVPEFLRSPFPNPAVLIGVSLKLRTIDVKMAQIHMFFGKYLFIDVVEQLLSGWLERFR